MTDKHFDSYEDQTKVKHEIFRAYFGVWVRILGKWDPRLNYLDGFAGRGIYGEGEERADGSPLIALDIAEEHKHEHGIDVFCGFCESKREYAKELEAAIEQRGTDVRFGVYCGAFADWLNQILEIKNLAPTFAFIDPCGWSGFPLELVGRFMQRNKTEAFINFMYLRVNEFLTANIVEKSFLDLFGLTNLEFVDFKKRINELSPADRERTIRDVYIQQLRKVARYVFPFKVKYPGKNRTYFYLIHCTNHLKGLDVMKNVMHAAGGHTLQYSALGPHESQLSLFDSDNPTVADLSRELHKRYVGKSKTFEQVLEETYQDTPFLEKHYREAIKKNLRNEGKVSWVPVSSATPNGLKGSDLITFL